MPAAEILVASASDLAPAHAELAESFQKLTGHRVRFVTGSSGMLAQQISSGAPYDLFLSAGRGFVEDLVKSGDVRADSMRLYAHGRLGLWSLSGKVRTIGDLLSADLRHVAIANPKVAPYGAAAKDLLVRERLWDRV
ncbi:MAG: molybdate ABC transporter substrate-binding protein, partial [Candidatus Solibacter usitatus]|nr:molybdate ABC transporter substrate-binding protein [Candidatus Solibacter usitatus]